jgi:hypothetical protein
VSEALRYGTWEGMHESGLTWEELHATGATWEELLTTPAPPPAPTIVQWKLVGTGTNPRTATLDADPTPGNGLLYYTDFGTTSSLLPNPAWARVTWAQSGSVGEANFLWRPVPADVRRSYSGLGSTGSSSFGLLLEIGNPVRGVFPPLLNVAGFAAQVVTTVAGPDVVVRPGAAPALLVAAIGRASPQAATPHPGWTELYDGDCDGAGWVSIQYRVAPTPGVYPTGASYAAPAGSAFDSYALATAIPPAHVPAAGSVQALNRWRRGQLLRAL